MFSLYNKYILPRLLDRDMGPEEFNETRLKIVGPAKGVVLEIGFGSGYNLPFYKNVEKLYALDPSLELYRYAENRIQSVIFPVQYFQCSAENIPLEESTVDTVVSTWSLCSIPDLSKALKEIHRVLKPDGKFLFVEHGLSPKKVNSIIQKLITPVIRHFTGNCPLDREIDTFIIRAGFNIEILEKFPEEGRPLMFSYRGIAVKN